MGRVASAVDNSMMESFFGTLQLELLDRRSWTTRAELASAIFEWIEGWYNPRRRHTSVASAPQPEPASDPQPSDIVARYDANGNGAIERLEFQQAKRDYADGLIEYAEMLAEPEPAGRGRRGAP